MNRKEFLLAIPLIAAVASFGRKGEKLFDRNPFPFYEPFWVGRFDGMGGLNVGLYDKDGYFEGAEHYTHPIPCDGFIQLGIEPEIVEWCPYGVRRKVLNP